MKRALILATVIVCLTATPALAQEPADASVEVALDLAYNLKYIWRGINLVDDPVFQPSASASWRGLTLSVWGSMETTNYNLYPGYGSTAGDFTEIDYTLDYSWSCGKVNLSGGVIHYQFPNTGISSTTELYLAAGLDVPLAPTVTVYQDVDEADGTYATLSLGHTLEDVWKPAEGISMSVDLSASVGFGSSDHNGFYYGTGDAGFTDATLSAGLPFKLGERLTLTPSINYSALLDSDLRSGMARDDNLWAGISLGLSF